VVLCGTWGQGVKKLMKDNRIRMVISSIPGKDAEKLMKLTSLKPIGCCWSLFGRHTQDPYWSDGG
jgi:hypothetical protein